MIIDTDRFFYGIFNRDNTLLKTREITGNPVVKIPSQEELHQTYNAISVVVIEDVLHLPSYLEGERFTRSAFTKLPHTVYEVDKFTGQDIKSHYLLSEQLVSAIRSFYDGKLRHISTLLGDYLYPSSQKKILAFLSSTQIHLFVSDQVGLKFYNKYRIETPEDALYYAIAVCQLQNLDPAHTSIEIAGRCDKQSPIARLLSDYFAELYFCDWTVYKSEMDIFPHIYLDLFLANQ